MKPFSPRFSPDDYDQHGALRLPLGFWAVLILQARTWLLFVMAGVSREQGESLLALFYPDTQRFWYGMLLGLPAALGGSLFSLWRQDGDAPGLELALALLDALALSYLLLNARLKACFAPAGRAD